jgi:uncharacterized protein (TIGR00730 family)
MTGTLSVCVYCSSSDAVDQGLRKVAADLGEAIAWRRWRLVYGGGDVGLMGEVARAALGAGAHVTGVIPHRLAEREVALGEVTELIRVDTMRERKRLMDERADAFLVLPGGIGTLEELMEVLTLKHLGFHARPIVLLDADGFWRPLRRLLDEMVAAGMAPASIFDLLRITKDVDEALDAVADGIAYGETSGRGAEQAEVEAGADPSTRPQD